MRKSADYYGLLHLQPDAPAALIKASYRTLMQKLKMHPDLGGDADAACQLNAAYATLCNPELRAQYDRTRDASPGQPAQPCTPPPTPNAQRVMWTDDDAKSAVQCLFCSTPHSYHAYPPRTAHCGSCHSPLAPAKTRQLLDGERRVLERLNIERNIQYRSLPGSLMHNASTSDLSLNGLKFSTVDDLVHNQLLQIVSPFCHALGRIAHVTGQTENHHQFGVEFVTLCFPNATGSLVSTHA